MQQVSWGFKSANPRLSDAHAWVTTWAGSRQAVLARDLLTRCEWPRSPEGGAKMSAPRHLPDAHALVTGRRGGVLALVLLTSCDLPEFPGRGVKRPPPTVFT